MIFNFVAIEVVCVTILKVLDITLVFKDVKSLVFAFKLIRLDKLEVSIAVPPPPLEKL